jgi:uncharacterized phage protein gp47/JayE
MPFSRPTLTTLRNQVAQDIASALQGSDALLRFSNLNITGVAQANLANLHYGYLDWIAKQSNPFTATEEFLEAWAALKDVFRKPATSASGGITFQGTNGRFLPSGSAVVRGDGVTGKTTADSTVSGGVLITPVAIDADLTGKTGAFGNTDIGVNFTINQAVDGIQSNGLVTTEFTGGADLELDDSLRSRMLEAYQSQAQGGAETDYIDWALAVPGCTRAWCARNANGAGTVVIYVMFDVSEADHGGFPQGDDGVATDETRGTAATGDQLAIADYLYPLQPVTALVSVIAPTAAAIDFTISGIPSGQRDAATAAIADVFLREGNAKGGTVPIVYVWTAIASVSGISNFVITIPSGDITNTAGTLPTVGTITWT